MVNSIFQVIKDTALLFSAVSDTEKLDAQLLIAHVLHKNVTYLHTWPDVELNAEQLTTLEALVSRRLTGEPIAYILGSQEFWSLPFLVSPATLIPRPDTEVLIETVLNHHSDSQHLRCLDLGTGTGAIALSLASEQPNWHVEAIDYSGDAVALAQKNAKHLQLTSVNIYQSDWFSNVATTHRFDIIVSNPPYIDEADKHLGEGDVRFEPKSALVAENKGLADIQLITEQSLNYLNLNGYLYIEHGFDQGALVRDILLEFGYTSVITIKDYGENDRITYGKATGQREH